MELSPQLFRQPLCPTKSHNQQRMQQRRLPTQAVIYDATEQIQQLLTGIQIFKKPAIAADKQMQDICP